MEIDWLNIFVTVLGPGFLGAMILAIIAKLGSRRREQTELKLMEANTRKAHLEIDLLSKRVGPTVLHEREVGRVKTGKKDIVLKEEERKIRGGM